MSEIRTELIIASRRLVGRPFNQHYVNRDPCTVSGDITNPACMERGLDKYGEGLDCMGVVIRGMAGALGVDVSRWSTGYRHLEQYESLGQKRPEQIGDIILFNRPPIGVMHMGVVVGRTRIVHATNADQAVVETSYYFHEQNRFLDPEELAELPILVAGN